MDGNYDVHPVNIIPISVAGSSEATSRERERERERETCVSEKVEEQC